MVSGKYLLFLPLQPLFLPRQPDFASYRRDMALPHEFVRAHHFSPVLWYDNHRPRALPSPTPTSSHVLALTLPTDTAIAPAPPSPLHPCGVLPRSQRDLALPYEFVRALHFSPVHRLLGPPPGLLLPTLRHLRARQHLPCRFAKLHHRDSILAESPNLSAQHPQVPEKPCVINRPLSLRQPPRSCIVVYISIIWSYLSGKKILKYKKYKIRNSGW